MIDKIKRILDDKISAIKKEKHEIQKLHLTSLDIEQKTIDKLKLVCIDCKNLLYLTDEDLKFLKGCFNLKDINKILVYRSFLKNVNYVFKDSFLIDLNQICNSIIDKFETQKKQLAKTNENLEELLKEQNELSKLKNKIYSNFSELLPSDIDMFYNLFKEMNISTKESIDLILFINNMYFNNNDFIDENEEVVEETNLNREYLEELFLEYGYNFNNLKTKNQDEIIKFGNIDNIRSIFEVLNQNEINLNVNIVQTPIISAKSDQITKILVYSTPTIVEKLLEFALEKGIKKGEKVDFVALLETPTIFISRKRKYISKTINSGEGHSNLLSSGRNEDFIKNISLLEEKYKQVVGDDQFVNKIFNKCDSIFDNAHEQIINVIKVFELYGISPEYYLNSLSCFNSVKQADTFDLSIELGCFDYIKDNMSKAMLKVDDKMFLKMAIALKEKYGLIFCYSDKMTITGVRSCLQFREASLTRFIDQNDLTFEKFDLRNSFSEDANRIFEEIENILSKNNNDTINISTEYLSKDDNILSLLEPFTSKDNPMIYEINDVRISKFKVFRLYNTLKLHGYNDSLYSIIYILTRNSYITQDKFNELKDTIRTLFKGKVKTL